MKVGAAFKMPFAALAVFVAAGCIPAFAQVNVSYPGDIVYATTGQAVTFSHQKHVDELGMECSDCHTKIFEMKAYAARDNGDFNMDALNSGKYCGKCHNGEMAFSTDDFNECAKCHSGPESGSLETAPAKIPGPPAPITFGEGDNIAVFKHDAHRGVECATCHTKLFPLQKTKDVATMDDINAGKSCGKCHNGKIAFDAGNCGKCHPKM